MVAIKTDAQVSHLADNGLPVTSADVRRLLAEKKALREALELALPTLEAEFRAWNNHKVLWPEEVARHAEVLNRARAALRSEQGESNAAALAPRLQKINDPVDRLNQSLGENG